MLKKYTFGELLAESATRYADNEAIRFKGNSITYRELKERVDSFAAGLLELGLQRGEKVAIWMPDCPEWIYALFAVTKIGGVVASINARYRTDDAQHVLEHSDASIVVTTDRLTKFVDYVGMLYQMYPAIRQGNPVKLKIGGAPFLKSVIYCGEREHEGMLRFEDVLERERQSGLVSEVQSRSEQVMPEDVALFQYTSGTTAWPKACMHTQEVLVRSGLNIAKRLEFREEQERIYDPLPLFHLAGLYWGPVACMSRGCCRVMVEHFDAEEAMKTIEADKCTGLYGFGETILSIITHPNFRKYDLSSLRLGFAGYGEPLRRIHEVLPNYRFPGPYGTSEACIISWADLSDDIEIKATTCGRPPEGVEVRIVDPETGRALPAGKVGEICSRGWSMMKGYYKDPEGTAKVLDKEGWMHTEDLGLIGADGRLRFQGRIKFVLKVGGENVSAEEVENFLIRHPKVKVAQVIGIPDQKYAEVPAAIIEFNPGASCTEQEIIQFCEGKIASFKIPRYVRFVTEWPMSATKIQKFKLREKLLAELGLAGRGSRVIN